MRLGFGVDLKIDLRTKNIELKNSLARETLIETPLGSRVRIDYQATAEAQARDYQELRK